jgi:hypothetical protein
MTEFSHSFLTYSWEGYEERIIQKPLMHTYAIFQGDLGTIAAVQNLKNAGRGLLVYLHLHFFICQGKRIHEMIMAYH